MATASSAIFLGPRLLLFLALSLACTTDTEIEREIVDEMQPIIASTAVSPAMTPTVSTKPAISPTLPITLAPTSGLQPTELPPTATRGPTSTPIPIVTSTPSPKLGFGPGTYQVNDDIQPGIYAGKAGTGVFGSCYWERLSGVSGEFSDIIVNDNAVGQFYIEILPTDKYFKIDCDITPLDAWPEPAEPLSDIELGTYLVGRDIAPGTYQGKAGTGVLDSCYWGRLSGVSGEFSDVIANDNAVGNYFVSVKASDFALSTTCDLELEDEP